RVSADQDAPRVSGDRTLERRLELADLSLAIEERLSRGRGVTAPDRSDGGGGRDGGLLCLHRRDEAKSPSADRLDQALGVAVVPEDLAGDADRLHQGGVGDADARPELGEELVLLNDALAVPYEKRERLHDLGRHLDDTALLLQLPPLFIELE